MYIHQNTEVKQKTGFWLDVYRLHQAGIFDDNQRYVNARL